MRKEQEYSNPIYRREQDHVLSRSLQVSMSGMIDCPKKDASVCLAYRTYTVCGAYHLEGFNNTRNSMFCRGVSM